LPVLASLSASCRLKWPMERDRIVDYSSEGDGRPA
jgi:hypothetical protein